MSINYLTPLLSAQDLCITVRQDEKDTLLVKGISLTIHEGETLALVGESGSGKTLTGLSLLGLLPKDGPQIQKGTILFKQENISSFNEQRWRSIRGKEISLVPQSVLGALNPTLSIGSQLLETVYAHQHLSKKSALDLVFHTLDRVGLSQAKERLNAYPHEFSGGMRQRVLIAMALINRPKLIIADEPTTALDVTVQAQILDLLKKLQEEDGVSMLFITHDLGIVARLADRVAVMQHGQIVECNSANEIFYKPQHMYTQSLLASIPRLDQFLAERGVDIDKLSQSCTSNPTLAV